MHKMPSRESTYLKLEMHRHFLRRQFLYSVKLLIDGFIRLILYKVLTWSKVWKICFIHLKHKVHGGKWQNTVLENKVMDECVGVWKSSHRCWGARPHIEKRKGQDEGLIGRCGELHLPAQGWDRIPRAGPKVFPVSFHRGSQESLSGPWESTWVLWDICYSVSIDYIGQLWLSIPLCLHVCLHTHIHTCTKSQDM